MPDITASAATASLLLLGDDGDCPVGGDPSIGAQSASFSITIYGEAAIGGCATDLKKDANGFGPVFVADPGNCADFDSRADAVVHRRAQEVRRPVQAPDRVRAADRRRR